MEDGKEKLHGEERRKEESDEVQEKEQEEEQDKNKVETQEEEGKKKQNEKERVEKKEKYEKRKNLGEGEDKKEEVLTIVKILKPVDETTSDVPSTDEDETSSGPSEFIDDPSIDWKGNSIVYCDHMHVILTTLLFNRMNSRAKSFRLEFNNGRLIYLMGYRKDKLSKSNKN